MASIDFSSTINGNDPREENNEAIYGGVLWKNSREKALLLLKAAGVARLPFSRCICDAVINSLKTRPLMNGLLYGNLLRGLVLFQAIVSFPLPAVWTRWPWAFDSSLKVLFEDAPSQCPSPRDCTLQIHGSLFCHWPQQAMVYSEACIQSD